MKDIIIIGTGKAALLHSNSYKKIKKKGKLFFVDIKKNNRYNFKDTIYNSIEECIKENNLDVTNLIVDICTPKSEFLNIIKECDKLGIKDILVEKPFVIDKKNEKKLSHLNIIMVENYLYSKLTKAIKEYIDTNNKDIRLIYTNFSKNRVDESLSNRGFNDVVTLNYEIEMPHQVYLTQYFLNNKRVNNSITCSRDLHIGPRVLENHAYGLIVSKSGNIDIIYESNLASIITQKRIIITTKDNYTIEGNYAIYSDDLVLLKPANMTVYHNGKVISFETIEVDDNFAYFIENAYKYFNKKGNNPNIVDIPSFSKLMTLYCNNLIKRKKNI